MKKLIFLFALLSTSIVLDSSAKGGGCVSDYYNCRNYYCLPNDSGCHKYADKCYCDCKKGWKETPPGCKRKN
jgi:hypothetical protein